MSSLPKPTPQRPTHGTSTQSQQDLLSPLSDVPSVLWAHPVDARTPSFNPPPPFASPQAHAFGSQSHASPNPETSSSAQASPATSLESADSEDDALRTPEDRLHAFAPRKSPAAASLLLHGDHGLSPTATAWRPTASDDYFSLFSSHGPDHGLGISLGERSGARVGIDELARGAAQLDLNLDKAPAAAPLQTRRDSFTFHPSPSFLVGSPSPRKPRPFASSATLRSPESPLVRRQALPLRLPASTGLTMEARPPPSLRGGPGTLERSRAVTMPPTPSPLPHESPALTSTSTRRSAPLPPPPSMRFDPSPTVVPTMPPPGAAQPTAPKLPSLSSSRAPLLPLFPPPAPLGTPHAPQQRAPPHSTYPLSPADVERVAALHSGRVPSLQQLAPPQHEVAAAAAGPVVNTGNVGPMVVQVGDWRCGVCAYVNWRRRKICMKCFPYANDVGEVLTIKSQRAAHLAKEPSPSVSALVSPASSPEMGGPASASSSALDGYFAAGHAHGAFPHPSSPQQVRRTVSDPVYSAAPVPALARVPSAPMRQPPPPHMRPPLVPTRSFPGPAPNARGFSTPGAAHTRAPSAPLPLALPHEHQHLRPLPLRAPDAPPVELASPSSSGVGSAGDLVARQAAAERMRAMVQARAGAAGRH